MPKCIDCNNKTVSRSSKAKRCRECDVKRRNRNAKGRAINKFCKKCESPLSAIKNATGLCRACFLISNPVPANKGDKGRQVAWNKGVSRFGSESEKRLSALEDRRARYKKLSSRSRIIENIRCLIRNHINSKSKEGKRGRTLELLGCNRAYFINHIEGLWSKGMSWGNYGNGAGLWSIDHIKPISRFDGIELLDVQKIAFNYLNCQPMWSNENSRKGNRYEK